MAEQQVRSVQDLIQQGAVTAPVQRLDAHEKEELASAGTELVVSDVRYGSDPKIGGYWSVVATADGEQVQFNLGEHSRRDTFMQSLAIACADGPIGGLVLKAYPGKQGNAFVTLEPMDR